jgi:hypothetical protein
MRIGIHANLNTGEDVRAAISALVGINVELMRTNPDAWPSVYAAGLRYVPETPGEREKWQTAPELLARGFGDCEDLSSYTVARYIVRGVPAMAGVFPTDSGFHIVVILPNGDIEDPSARTGMLR